ncbi:MAG: nucleotidyltransferase family protein [Chthoniobacterales bacterium]
MKAGIFAAGRGSRLRSPGNPLKPLVRVRGRGLIEHVLHAMAGAAATEVVIIINEDSLAVREQVAKSTWPFALRWIVENTPTSMHSFLRLVETLADDGDVGPFLISTVDTVTSGNVYAHFFAEAQSNDAAVTLALTAPGDDEKPLLVRLGSDRLRVLAMGEGAASSHATAGIYAVRPSILREAEAARRDGVDALRVFLGRLLERGYPLAGIPIGQTIDVDRPADIETAEAFLRSGAL